MKKTEYIKPKFKSQMIVDLQSLVLKDTNAGLISTGIHFACRKFIDELRKIPLSEELQHIRTVKDHPLLAKEDRPK